MFKVTHAWFRRLAHRGRALIRALPQALALGLAVAPPIAWAAPEASAPRPAPFRPQPVGTEVALDACLRAALLGFTERSGALQTADWVTLRVDNDCDVPVRHLRVDLLLLDVLGRPYGATLWLLERGEVLWPGRSKTDRYPVADPGEHTPQRWALRLRHVERPIGRNMERKPERTSRGGKPAARPLPAETRR